MEKGSDRKILVILFTGVLMGALDTAIVGPATPSIEAAFGSPVFGRLINIYWSRLIIILGLILAGAGFFLLRRHLICPDTEAFSFTSLCYLY
ncbi:MAG: hypothetical protein ACQETA_11255 [Bacteroidota bacterium]